MAKTHFHSNPQQRWFKPSSSTGVRFAKYGTRYGPQGVVIGGAIGFVAGALIGGALDELDVI